MTVLMPIERVQWHLANWADWMQGLRVGSGYRTRASGGFLCQGSRDFDSMVASADARCAEAVNACIDDLPTDQQMAVHYRMLGTRTSPSNVALAFEEARARLAREIPAKGID